jgi:hypothetical protein
VAHASGTPLPEGAVRSVARGNGQSRALVLGTNDNPQAPCWQVIQVIQVIRGAELAGKRISISADGAYLTDERPETPWNGVLFVLHQGESAAAPLLKPDPSPFWLPLSHAPPTGEFGTIRAQYDVPAGAEALCLRILLQPKVGMNLAAVDNVRLSIVEPVRVE